LLLATSASPANTLADTLKTVGKISAAARDLATEADNLKTNLLEATVTALQAMSADPRETNADAEVIETTAV
jgi:hypothetical protein